MYGFSGLSVDASVSTSKTVFDEGLFFTHRGLSGPSILQILSYWQKGMEVAINLVPQEEYVDRFMTAKEQHPKETLHTLLL